MRACALVAYAFLLALVPAQPGRGQGGAPDASPGTSPHGAPAGFSPSNDYHRKRDAVLSRDVYEIQRPGYSEPSGYQLVRRVDRGGFQAALYRDRATGEYVVAYAGTDPLELSDVVADSEMLNHPAYQPETLPGLEGSTVGPSVLDEYVSEARTFYREAEDLTGGSPRVTGHSLGGFLAQVVGTEEGVGTSTFNAPGVPPELGDLYGIKVTPSNVTNYGREDDLVFNFNEPHLGAREDQPNVGGPLANHGIGSLANEAEEGLSGYRRPASPEEYDEALRDMGMEPDPADPPRSEMREPSEPTDPKRVRAEPTEDGSGHLDPGGSEESPPEEAMSPLAEGEAQGDWESSAPVDTEPQADPESPAFADTEAEGPFDLDADVDYEDEEQPEPQREEDPYDNYKKYAAEFEDEATEISVTHLDGYESTTLEELNANWDADQDRIHDELGAVDIGVWHPNEDTEDSDLDVALVKLEKLASDIRTEPLVQDFRETLGRDRGVAGRMEQRFAAIEAERQRLAEGRERALDDAMRTLATVANLAAATRASLEAAAPGGGGGGGDLRGGGGSCPRVQAEMRRRLQAATGGRCAGRTGICMSHRCHLRLIEITAWGANQCPEVSAAERQNANAALRSARADARRACAMVR
jgi:hypothetical protein